MISWSVTGCRSTSVSWRVMTLTDIFIVIHLLFYPGNPESHVGGWRFWQRVMRPSLLRAAPEDEDQSELPARWRHRRNHSGPVHTDTIWGFVPRSTNTKPLGLSLDGEPAYIQYPPPPSKVSEQQHCPRGAFALQNMPILFGLKTRLILFLILSVSSLRAESRCRVLFFFWFEVIFLIFFKRQRLDQGIRKRLDKNSKNKTCGSGGNYDQSLPSINQPIKLCISVSGRVGILRRFSSGRQLAAHDVK